MWMCSSGKQALLDRGAVLVGSPEALNISLEAHWAMTVLMTCERVQYSKEGSNTGLWIVLKNKQMKNPQTKTNLAPAPQNTQLQFCKTTSTTFPAHTSFQHGPFLHLIGPSSPQTQIPHPCMIPSARSCPRFLSLPMVLVSLSSLQNPPPGLFHPVSGCCRAQSTKPLAHDPPAHRFQIIWNTVIETW